MSLLNRPWFFDQVRRAPFGGPLRQAQVSGCTALLDAWEFSSEVGSHRDDRWLAYALGTAYHETARTMQPVREIGRGKGQPYGVPDPVTGLRYYGRGYVQLTWAKNYQRMSERLGVDFYRHPDLALDPHWAAEILYVGMIEGLFTGKDLGDYFTATRSDWVQARRVVNALDCATMVAGYARAFYAALSYTT